MLEAEPITCGIEHGSTFGRSAVSIGVSDKFSAGSPIIIHELFMFCAARYARWVSDSVDIPFAMMLPLMGGLS
jgi:hypothetical protein